MRPGTIIALAATVTIGGAAHLSASQAIADQQGCPVWTAGTDCTAATALSYCEEHYTEHYPDCTLVSAHCSVTENYNCFPY